MIEATISYGGYTNELFFKKDKDGNFMGNCDCRFYFSRENPCGHFILLAMKLKELYPFNIPFKYRDHRYSFTEDDKMSYVEKINLRNYQLTTERLIQGFKRDAMNSIFSNNESEDVMNGDVTLLIEYSKEFRGPSYTLKIAKKGNRPYIVKNIANFIDSIENEEYVSYGKNLAFKHKLSAFDDSALKIIDTLKYNCIFTDDYRERNIIAKSRKAFFDLLYSLPSENLINLSLSKEILKSNLLVENHDDYIKIVPEDRSTRIDSINFDRKGDDFFVYCYGKSKIREYKANEDTIVLIRHFMYYEALVINEDSYDDFYNFIYKPTHKYFNYVGYEFNSNNSLVDKIEIYGDLDDDYSLSLVVNYYQNDMKNYLYLSNNLPFECEIIKACIDRYNPSIDMETGKVLIDEDKYIAKFIETALPLLTKYADVYVSDAIKNYNNPKRIGINVGVKIENDLLNIDINSLKISKDEIADVLASYHRKKRFHRLKNGEMIAINKKEMEELENTIDEIGIDLKDIDKNINLPLYKALALETISLDNELNYDKTDEYKEFISKIEMKDIDSYEVPDGLKDILKEYQVYGYRWLMTLRNWGLSGILADDMGLGKTLQFITYVKANKNGNNTSLVICPASLIYNWEDEVKKFASDLKVLCISGNGPHREELIKQIGDYDLVVTSYDYIRRDYKLYEDFIFDTIVLDEAQYIKNQVTKNARSVKELKSKYRLALSGTPIENSLAELWSIFDFLMPGYLNNYHYFKNNYEKDIVKNNDEEKIKRLKSFVEPFILRRRKMDVLKELPPRIDKTIYIEFNEDEEKLYQANAVLANSQLQSMLEVDNINTSKIEIFAMLNKLRQLCIEPRLQYDNIDEISSKMKACIELLDRLKSNNEKVLIFSSYTSLLALLEEELKKHKFSYYKLTGETSKEERRNLVNKFQKDNTDVFLISLKAGGTGINLTKASAVIHFDPWWNLSAQNQASDRAHRIGQENTVQVFSLIMKNSIEERIEDLQKRKKELSDLFTEGNNGSIASMTKDDLLYLFSTK